MAGKRLPVSELVKVSASHVWWAIQNLLDGQVPGRFGASVDYDLVLDDGRRLPPKAVFGLAASEALGIPIGPEHFTAGESSACFRILRQHGYMVLPKAEKTPVVADILTVEDRVWCEGKRKLTQHLIRERSNGAPKAKKEAFLREHGRLFCERCEMDPVQKYGVHGVACIEVHHYARQVRNMASGHQTRLEDLQCLCANCHRILHSELKRYSKM